jgi:hypothetical protein
MSDPADLCDVFAEGYALRGPGSRETRARANHRMEREFDRIDHVHYQALPDAFYNTPKTVPKQRS